MSSATAVADALACAAMGFFVLPLAPGEKHPIAGFKNWASRASRSEALIRAWWRRWPKANVGVVLQPGQLTIDIDPRHGGLEVLEALTAKHGPLPGTWQAWSGRQDGGCHLHFTVPTNSHVPYTYSLDPGRPLAVEVLGPGHLVVMPPSVHPDTGRSYTWGATYSPDTKEEPAQAPGWLLTLLGDTGETAGNNHAHPRTTRPSNKVPYPPPGTLFEAQGGPGARLVRMACDPANLPALLRACGLPDTLEVLCGVRCPFHSDEHPSATLLGPTTDHRSYGLHCFACQRYYSLVDIYYYRTSARLLHLHTEFDGQGRRRNHTALRLQWLTRLLEAAGVLHLYELGAPSLPPQAPDVEKAVFAVALHLRRIRAATREAGAPFPLSLRFVADWLGDACQWSLTALNEAKRRVIARGLLSTEGRDTAGERLWSIGKAALRRARKDAPILKTEAATIESVQSTAVPEASAPSSACPDAHTPEHDHRACVRCVQQRLEELRRRAGIVHDPLDPYGLCVPT